MKKILFVCIHNSARSQMAEAYLNRLGAGKFFAESAGLEGGQLNPLVVKSLLEEGIDISAKKTQTVDEVLAAGKKFDIVITVCDEAAAEQCPVFPGTGQKLHWGFPDPSKFTGTDAEKLRQISSVRDTIREKIKAFLAATER